MEIGHKELRMIVRQHFNRGVAVDIKGAVGIGKSFVVKEEAKLISEELKLDFVEWNEISLEEKQSLLDKEKAEKSFIFADIRLSQCGPEDLKGLPKLEGSHVDWLPDLLIRVISNTNIKGVLFFDEMNLACFPAGTQISCLGGLKDIEHINIGDKTLNMNGQYDTVEQTFVKDYKGNVVKIKALNMLPYVCTEDHPILISKVKHKYVKLGKNKYTTKAIIPAPEWITAKEIDNTMYVAVPKLKGDIDIETINLKEFDNYLPKHCNITMKLDEDLCWFLGLYVAEGYADQNRVGICLGAHEDILIEKTIKIIKKYFTDSVASNKSRKNNSYEIRFNAPIICKALKEWFGRSARAKKIPDFLLRNKNINLLKAFLNGYFEGDGSFVSLKTISMSTASRTLAHQLQLAFTRFNIVFNVNCEEKPRTNYIKGRKVVSGNAYIIKTRQDEAHKLFSLKSPHKKNRRLMSYFADDNFLYCKLLKKETTHFEGKVYNFETSTTHTYVVNNQIVHNCPSVQASAYQIVHDSQIGNWPISKHVLKISAGNSSEDGANVFQEPAPLLNRRSNFVLRKPIVDDWIEDYAFKADVDFRVMGFLKFSPSLLHKYEKNTKDVSFPTPRAWDRVSRLIKGIEELDKVYMFSAGVIGEGAATNFRAFIKLSEKIDLKALLKDPKKYKIGEMGIDMKYSIVSGICELYRKDTKIIEEVVNLSEFLEPDYKIFMFRSMMASVDKKKFMKEIMATKGWKKLSSELEKYIF